jgi:hypothetical protein
LTLGTGRRASFVVRVVDDGPGRVSGVIERVATGAKEPFTGLEVVGPLIGRMLRRQDVLPSASARPPAPEDDLDPGAGGVGRSAPAPGDGTGATP